MSLSDYYILFYPYCFQPLAVFHKFLLPSTNLRKFLDMARKMSCWQALGDVLAGLGEYFRGARVKFLQGQGGAIAGQGCGMVMSDFLAAVFRLFSAPVER